MTNSDCLQEADLRAFLLGELPERLSRWVTAHLESCPACEAAARRLDLISDPTVLALRRAAGTPDVAASDDPDFVTPLAGRHVGDAPVPRFVGPFELLEELGRGGWSVVYRARQRRPDRLVALKMLSAGPHAELEWRIRFLAEADALARLQHPGIVQVFEVGSHEGRPYLALELVGGGSLADHIKGKPVPPRVAADLVMRLAQAIHFAHQHGVIHRDLKPANVLLAEDGTPKVTDFGHAKLGRGDLTATGVVMGTPWYMAPEQARGDTAAVTTVTDVYGLGATLYELLAGRPPFTGATGMDLLERICRQEPTPPSQLRPGVPRDLEVVCLKCLHKEPARRYASAADLADDLGRFLDGRPVAARPVGRFEAAWSWCRRNPALAAVAAVAAAALVAVAAVSLGFAVHAHFANVALQQEQQQTEQEKQQAEAARGTAVLQQRLAERHLAQSNLQAALDVCPQDPGRGLLLLARALANTPDHAADLRQAARLNFAAWEPLVLPLQAIWPAGPMAFSPDGRTALGHSDGTLRFWAVGTGDPLTPPLEHPGSVGPMAFSADGSHAAVCGGDRVRILDAATGRQVAALEHRRKDLAAALSPDGRRAATVSQERTVRLWDVGTGQASTAPLEHEAAVHALAFSPDGRTLATGCAAGTVSLWDVATGTRKHPALPLLTGAVARVAFSADGRRLLAHNPVTHSNRPAARVADAATGRPLGDRPIEHPDGLMDAALSADGEAVVTGGIDMSARLWDAATGAARQPIFRLPSTVVAVAFSPDGRTVLAGTYDRAARLWDVATGRALGQSLSHRGPLTEVAFARDGTTFRTTGADGTRVWRAVPAAPPVVTLPHPEPVHAAVLSPDGRTVLTAGEKVARAWDAATGEPRGGPFQQGVGIGQRAWLATRVLFTADGRAVLSAGRSARLWDAATGATLRELSHPAEPGAVGFSPDVWTVAVSLDGRRFATASDSTVRLWDAGGGALVAECKHLDRVEVVRFAPDGRSVVTAAGRAVRLWSAEDGSPLGPPLPHSDSVSGAAISPDGRFLVVASLTLGTGEATLWDLGCDPPVSLALRHKGGIDAVAFAPDGRSALTAGKDSTARLWQVPGGEPFGPPLRHESWLRAATFSPPLGPDGPVLVATGSFDMTARLWHQATGYPVGPPLSHPRGPGGAAAPAFSAVLSAAFSPDGCRLLTRTTDGTAHVWAVPLPLDVGPESARRMAELLTGMELDQHGVVSVLLQSEWRRRR